MGTKEQVKFADGLDCVSEERLDRARLVAA
jgi:hypothetical protein